MVTIDVKPLTWGNTLWDGAYYTPLPDDLPDILRQAGCTPADILTLVAIVGMKRDGTILRAKQEEIRRRAGLDSLRIAERCVARLISMNLLERVKNARPGNFAEYDLAPLFMFLQGIAPGRTRKGNTNGSD